jgi:carboxyl-terminal processing protease
MRLPLLSLLLLVPLAPAEEAAELARRLAEQIAVIEQESATPVSRAALWQGAMRGLVAASDPHAAYLSREDLALHGETQRDGFGFAWRTEAGTVRVTRVVRGGPAAQAGLHAGARLISLDGKTLEDPSTLARTPDAITLGWVDAFGDAHQTHLMRAACPDDGIDATTMPEPGILHVRISRFMAATDAGEPWTATFAGMQRMLSGSAGLRAVVLDLRGNSGGNLQAAVEIAGGWLSPNQAVIEQVGRHPGRNRIWRANPPRLPDVPVVVLIDGETASAAEVLAHALRRVRGSPLVGMPSHGKWSVQQLFLLPQDEACLLTVAQLHAPGGGPLDRPLTPDALVQQERAACWQRWQAEAAGIRPLPSDPVLDRGVELARGLIRANNH